MSDQRVFISSIQQWAQANPRPFPWRETDDPYRVLIGEILLQRTRGEHVVPVYEEFLRRWPSIEKFSRAREGTVARVIYPLGLAKRAKILVDLAKALGDKGYVPTRVEELAVLPGVGRYTAHAVPIFAAKENLPLVDWVIARVLRRYFGLFPLDRRPNSDHELWAIAARLAQQGAARDLWMGTLDFSAAICRPRPLCPRCPLSPTCEWAKSSDSVPARR